MHCKYSISQCHWSVACPLRQVLVRLTVVGDGSRRRHHGSSQHEQNSHVLHVVAPVLMWNVLGVEV